MAERGDQRHHLQEDFVRGLLLSALAASALPTWAFLSTPHSSLAARRAIRLVAPTPKVPETVDAVR